MKIANHLLYLDDSTPCRFRQTPNCGGVIQPELLVIHFTSGSTAEGAVDWLCNPGAKASAHLVIGRDGSVTQLAPFNCKTWHAGESEWKGRRWCNGFAVGIELDNAGKMNRRGGKWISEFRKPYADADVVEATHRNETTSAGWHRYTPEQLAVTQEIAALIASEYGIKEVVGHEDVAPKRKNDPGPAFPMEEFREHTLEATGGKTRPKRRRRPASSKPRKTRAKPAKAAKPSADRPEVRVATPLQYVTTTNLNIRVGPGEQYERVKGTTLPKGTTVRPVPQDWWYVQVESDSVSTKDLQGWVHSNFLSRVEDAGKPLPGDAAATPKRRKKTRAKKPVNMMPVRDEEAEVREQIAKQIVDFEARRDSAGHLEVYDLPAADGGGSYEVAGINQRYHPGQAAALRELINKKKYDEAEKLAREYIAQFTDGVARWTSHPAIEAYLRDSAFNRGPGGAARILQTALGVDVDGRVGPQTLEALQEAEKDPKKLLLVLRKARESYEIQHAGKRPQFWKGLVNRWDNALTFAQSLA